MYATPSTLWISCRDGHVRVRDQSTGNLLACFPITPSEHTHLYNSTKLTADNYLENEDKIPAVLIKKSTSTTQEQQKASVRGESTFVIASCSSLCPPPLDYEIGKKTRFTYASCLSYDSASKSMFVGTTSGKIYRFDYNSFSTGDISMKSDKIQLEQTHGYYSIAKTYLTSGQRVRQIVHSLCGTWILSPPLNHCFFIPRSSFFLTPKDKERNVGNTNGYSGSFDALHPILLGIHTKWIRSITLTKSLQDTDPNNLNNANPVFGRRDRIITVSSDGMAVWDEYASILNIPQLASFSRSNSNRDDIILSQSSQPCICFKSASSLASQSFATTNSADNAFRESLNKPPVSDRIKQHDVSQTDVTYAIESGVALEFSSQHDDFANQGAAVLSFLTQTRNTPIASKKTSKNDPPHTFTLPQPILSCFSSSKTLVSQAVLVGGKLRGNIAVDIDDTGNSRSERCSTSEQDKSKSMNLGSRDMKWMSPMPILRHQPLIRVDSNLSSY